MSAASTATPATTATEPALMLDATLASARIYALALEDKGMASDILALVGSIERQVAGFVSATIEQGEEAHALATEQAIDQLHAAKLRRDQLRRHNGFPPPTESDSMLDGQLAKYVKPAPVFEPDFGFGGRAGALVIEDDALWLRAAVEGNAGNDVRREGLAEPNAHWDAVVGDLLKHVESHGFVASVQHDIAAILLQVKGERQKELKEGGRSQHHGGPQFKTTILTMPAATGKTRAAEFLMRELGCYALVDEWHPTVPITWGALHLTNIPPRFLPSSIDGVRILSCGFGGAA